MDYVELVPKRRPPSRPVINWERLPLSRQEAPVREWLLRQAAAGLSAGTVDVYSRAVERYLEYCRARRLRPSQATTEHIAAYLRELAAAGLGGATLAQRLTALRLFYAHVVEQRLGRDNPALGAPVPQTHRDTARTADADSEAALAWIPDEAAWLAVLQTAGDERPRTHLMLALSYDAALRREEVCALRPVDADLRRGTLRVVGPSASAAPPRQPRQPGQGRVVPLSKTVAAYCADYLRARRVLTARPSARNSVVRTDPDASEGLFLSESPRNWSEPVSVWTWSKAVQAIGRRAGVERLTTATPRHLRLTDLARAGWTATELARFAGHRRKADVERYFALAREHPGPEGASGTDVLQVREEQLARLLFRRAK